MGFSIHGFASAKGNTNLPATIATALDSAFLNAVFWLEPSARLLVSLVSSVVASTSKSHIDRLISQIETLFALHIYIRSSFLDTIPLFAFLRLYFPSIASATQPESPVRSTPSSSWPNNDQHVASSALPFLRSSIILSPPNKHCVFDILL